MSVCNSLPVCKANCSVSTQWALAQAGEIVADADIVGAGVIISFIVTAHATFIVVVIGYFTFSFEDKCKNRADDKIVESTRRFLRRIYQKLRWIYQASKRLFQKPIFEDVDLSMTPISDRPEAEDEPVRKYRIEAIRGFMLALSDQQLVTGVAILVAVFGRWSEITVYSTNVVAALAYFSASVHVGTLDFLTTYLRKHGIVKGCRVAAMLMTMIMLVFIMVLQLSATWWEHYRRPNLFLICAFWDYSLAGTDGIFFLTRTYNIAFVLVQHYNRITTLYSAWGRLPQGEDEWTKGRLIKYNVKNFDYRIQIYKKQAQLLIVQDPSWRRTCRTWVMVESFAFHETHNSRIWQIASLLYSNIYGAILIFFYRGQHKGTVGPFNTMGFGQIVPVFLLILLIFAAIESIYGYRDALEEVSVQGSVTHSTQNAASLHLPSETGSLITGNADVGDLHEGTPQDFEYSSEVSETFQSHFLSEMSDASAVHENKNLSAPQSEILNRDDTDADEPSQGHYERDAHRSQAQNLEDLFIPQELNRSFSTGLDISLQRNDMLLRPVHNIPVKKQVRMTQLQNKPLTLSKADPSRIDISRSNASAEEYRSPTRIDTEARMDISISSAEALFNAVQENPKSLLARFIREDIFEVAEVHWIILAYAFFIVVIQVLLAISAQSILPNRLFVAVILLYVAMEIRHIADLLRRLERIKVLGNKTESPPQ